MFHLCIPEALYQVGSFLSSVSPKSLKVLHQAFAADLDFSAGLCRTSRLSILGPVQSLLGTSSLCSREGLHLKLLKEEGLMGWKSHPFADL